MNALKQLILGLLLIFVGHIDGMQLQHFKLPQDLIGAIGLLLVNTIGTPSIINKKDIPVIVRYLKALSLINKHYYQILNSQNMTDALLTAIATRFNITKLMAAEQVRSSGSKRWVEQLVRQSGEYELFTITKKIFDIASKLARQAAMQNIYFPNCGSLTQGVFVDEARTKTGLVLSINGSACYLLTPWGRQIIFHSDKDNQSWLNRTSLFQQLLKQIKTTFMNNEWVRDDEIYQVEKVIHPDWNNFHQDKSRLMQWLGIGTYVCKQVIAQILTDWSKISFYVPRIPDSSLINYAINYGFIKPLRLKECTLLSGTPAHIVCVNGASFYQINEVDSCEVPELTLADDCADRDSQERECLWWTMYELSQKETELKKSEPIECMQQRCSFCHNPIYVVDAFDKIYTLKCVLCESVFYCSKQCQTADWADHAAHYHLEPTDHELISLQSQLVQNIDEIPQLCTLFAEKLNLEPIQLSVSKAEFKFLPLYASCDRKICEIINTQAKGYIFIGPNWPIEECSDDQQRKGNKGINLLDPDRFLCSLGTLKEAYGYIIDEIKEGWVFTRLSEVYTDLVDIQSEEEWFLFIKTRQENEFEREQLLIKWLTQKFGLVNDLLCSAMKPVAKTMPRPFSQLTPKRLALWVKKKKLDEVNARLCFQLNTCPCPTDYANTQ